MHCLPLKIILHIAYYLFNGNSNEAALGLDCLYEKWEGLKSGTGRNTGWYAYSHLFKSYVVFMPSWDVFRPVRQGWMPIDSGGIPAKTGGKSPCKCVVPQSFSKYMVTVLTI